MHMLKGSSANQKRVVDSDSESDMSIGEDAFDMEEVSDISCGSDY